MRKYIPYTYYLYCKPANKHYYGVRYAMGCHPDDFWTKYFTSSKIIHKLIEYHGKDAFYFEIRKTFDNDPDKALKWEQKVLRRLRVENKEHWLNRGLSGVSPNFYSKGEVPWNKGISNGMKGQKFYNNGNVQKMYFPGDQPYGWIEGRLNRAWNVGKTAKEDTRVAENIRKMSVTKTGIPNPYKGKTKENCEWLAKLSKTISEGIEEGRLSKPDNKSWNKGLPAWNKGLTKETNESIAKMGRKQSIAIKEGRIAGPPSQKGQKRTKPAWNKGLTKN